jgi:hypothetical protein
MTATVTVSIIALSVSLASATASGVLATRQFRHSKRVVHFPAVADLLAEFRKAEFHDRYDYVVNRLAAEHSPDLGILGLPEPAKSAVLDIAFYFQTFASLRGFGILDETKHLGNLYMRIVEVWMAIQPFAMAERERSSGANRHTLAVLQNYAERLAQRGIMPGLTTSDRGTVGA